MKKNYKIMLIPMQVLPIPDVNGGAIERLITALINENEKYGEVQFIVASKYNEKAIGNTYKFTKIYYFVNDRLYGKRFFVFYLFLRIKFLLSTVCGKIIKFFNKINKNQQRCEKNNKPLDFYIYQCSKIAQREKVDAVISEGYYHINSFHYFHKIVGSDNLYYHLHNTRVHALSDRVVVPNSIAVSNYVLSHWNIDYANDTHKNVVLYNGINYENFNKKITSEKKIQLRQKLGIADTDIVVLYCGRIIKEKGIKQLVEAFSIINQKNIKLLIIGSVFFGAKTNDKEAAEFAKKILDNVNEMPNVIYLGYISNYEIVDYYKIADIQVVPSVCQEAAGLVAIEGMAAGLPLIITESGGMVEYVNEDCAIQVPIDKNLPQNLAASIQTLACDATKREKMSAAGELRAKQFTIEAFYKNFVKIFIDK